MRKKLLSGLFWVLLLNLLIKPFWILGIEVGVQNAVGAEAYGFYIAIFNFAYIFNILLDLGITNFNTRNIAQYPQLICKHISGILSIKIMLLGLFFLVTFTIGLLMGYDSRQFYLLLWLCFNQFLNSLITYLRSNFEGLLMFKVDSVLSIMDRLLMIIICGALLFNPNFCIEWFVYAQTVAYLITATVALIALFRRTGFRRLHWDIPFTLAILKQSAPFALLVLLMASYNRLDPVLLERLLPGETGDYQAGIYAGAFRLLDALTMLSYLVSVILLPIYTKITAPARRQSRNASLCLNSVAEIAETGAATISSVEKNNSELKSTTRLMFSLMMVFSVTTAVTCSFLSQPLMELLYREHEAESVEVFRILIFGLIPISITYIFGTLLTANGNLRQLNILAFITLVINISANIILIPRLAAVGSAWAGVSAQTFMAVTQMAVAFRIFHLRPSGGYIARLVAFCALIIAVNYFASFVVFPWWVQIVALFLIAIVVAMALHLIDIKEIINIIKLESTEDPQC